MEIMNNIGKYLRKLAKSDEYQLLYSKSKNLYGVALFENKTDFTYLQLIFLRWLEAYYYLYTELDMNERYISEDVINDDIRADAYLVYKKWKEKKEKKKERKSFPEDKRDTNINMKGIPAITFVNEE